MHQIAKDLHAGRVAGQDHGVGLMCEQCCAGGFTFEFKECGLAAFGYAVGAEQCHRQHLRAAASVADRSEEHTSELQSLMRISYAVFCLKKKKYCKNIDSFINVLYIMCYQSHYTYQYTCCAVI